MIKFENSDCKISAETKDVQIICITLVVLCLVAFFLRGTHQPELTSNTQATHRAISKLKNK